MESVAAVVARVRGDHLGESDGVLREDLCTCGPESTGTTELCRWLADHFGSAWQPEWARAGLLIDPLVYAGLRFCRE